MKKLILNAVVAIIFAACNPAPSPCECAGNSMKMVTGDADRELAYKCADHQNSLSARQKEEYLEEMLNCKEMRMK